MSKNFIDWHRKKIFVNERRDMDKIFFREKEIWWCSLGVNIGFEQDGKGEEFQRPVLIIKKFNQFVVLIVPLTTKIKKNNKYYYPCDSGDGISRMVIISQLRLIDTKRLLHKIGFVEKERFGEIKNAIKSML